MALCAMLSNGDKQEDASNAMENIFWTRPNNYSAIHPIKVLTSKTCAELATAGNTMPTATAFPFQRIRVKGDTQEIYSQVTTLTQDGGGVTENVTCGTKDQTLYTPYLCLDTRFVDVILRFSETHQSIQSIPI